MSKEDIFKLTETKPKSSSILTVLLGIMLVWWITSNYVLVMLIAIVGLGVTFMPSGFLIDREKSLIKRVHYLFGFSIGKWYELPNIKYISLLRVREKNSPRYIPAPAFIQNSSVQFVYQINLIIEEGRLKPFRLISTTRQQAIKTGLKLGEYLDLKVLDMTTPVKKWIR